MNYQAIANLVHDAVKNSTNLQSTNLSENIKPGEFSVIQNVFTKQEISGGVAAIEPGILDNWG